MYYCYSHTHLFTYLLSKMYNSDTHRPTTAFSLHVAVGAIIDSVHCQRVYYTLGFPIFPKRHTVLVPAVTCVK